MIEDVRKLQDSVKALLKDLRKIKSTQVWKKHVVELAGNIVDSYFRETRAKLVNSCVKIDAITDLDNLMHKLLEATHKATTTSAYKSIAKEIWSGLISLEKMMLLSGTLKTKDTLITPVDRTIIDTLTRIVPSAALSYEQALLDLDQPTRLSWRGPATDLREALRECLDHLAPDDKVEAQENYKREQGTKAPGPTMKQKVRFVLRKRELGENTVKTAEDAVDLVDTITGSFVRSVHSRASVSTHKPTKKSEVCRVRDFVRIALCEILSIQSD